ncbi:PREDICTED: facilitated trehalose transporter Tret1-2 homolog [Polistes dominula]|uniref:Facilitated trehalose transporter Tret1-2 homolog n=1 Tax=Polistes dominula TaxID=743375 RepID=A0ABM1IKP1_POLDO|nr:PREDICTED: facilitated trehalose transporter Tret1-2 homolog [Polistes dominula]
MVLGTSEENESMLGNNPAKYTKVDKAKDVIEDIQNNNSNTNLDGLYEVENVINRYSSNWKAIFAQCLVAGAVLLLAAGAGMPIGYSAVLLPQLSVKNATMYVDRELGSWIASVHSLATPIGSLLSGSFLDILGRRGSLQLSAIPLCLGWIVMGLAKNIPTLLCGRIICGVAVGSIAVPSQVFVGETADPGLRGILVGSSFAAYSFGILSVYAFGAFLKWNVVAFCSIVLPILAFFSLMFLPESPIWLIRQGKIEKAKDALLWLRGGDIEQMNTEITILEARAKLDAEQKSLATSFGQRVSLTMSIITSPNVLKPLFIINIFNVLQLSSGTYVIVFYAVDLVRDIGSDNMDSYSAAIITALTRFFFSLLACFLFLKIGRRSLGIFSAIGTSLASFVLVAYTLIKTEESAMDAYVLGICLFAYVGANTVGLFTLPGLMISELLPQNARGIAGGFNFFIFNILVFIATKFFPAINNAVGITGAFTIFAIFALLEAIFVYVALPETMNRTLEQIEDYFQQSNLLWITRSKEKRQNNELTRLS